MSDPTTMHKTLLQALKKSPHLRKKVAQVPLAKQIAGSMVWWAASAVLVVIGALPFLVGAPLWASFTVAITLGLLWSMLAATEFFVCKYYNLYVLMALALENIDTVLAHKKEVADTDNGCN